MAPDPRLRRVPINLSVRLLCLSAARAHTPGGNNTNNNVTKKNNTTVAVGDDQRAR